MKFIISKGVKIKQVVQEYNVLFWNFVNKYDTKNTNILRKIVHSFQVADICFFIACKMELNEEERNFCYLMGLLHDLGRFEQWKNYKTFDDVISIDHGDLSASIIEKISTDELLIDKDKKELLIQSIKYHTKKYDGNDEKIIFYNSLLNNADSFANVTTCANGAQQVLQTKDGYTKEIYEGFINRDLMRKYSPKTKLDRCLSLTACIYYVKFDFLREEIINKKYINVIYETLSKYLNDEDKNVYKIAINEMMKNYIK